MVPATENMSWSSGSSSDIALENHENFRMDSDSSSEDSVAGGGLLSSLDIPPIFTELLELNKYEDGYMEWKEIARWIKYEEDVEEEGNRWTKPHISTPTLQGWLELRKNLKNGLIMIDLEAKDLNQICEIVSRQLTVEGSLSADNANKLKDLWQRKHRHQFEGPRKVEGTLSRALKDLIVSKLENKATSSGLRVPSRGNSRPESRRGSMSMQKSQEEEGLLGTERRRNRDIDDGKVNLALQKKISNSSEAAIILEGGLGFVEKPVSVFVRLAKPIVLGDLPEVDIPTRFIYFFIGPAQDLKGIPSSTYADLGISLATAITNRKFCAALYNARTGSDICDAFDLYTNELKVLPGDFNTNLNKIEPPANTKEKKMSDELEEIDEDRRMREQSGLVRSGKFFGGLIRDIQRKKKHYLSDILEGFHPQCISSFLFLYFACLAPIVAFGGLLGEATENRIATIESLISGLISGVLFGLFAGQPLIILGSTGPVYVFEKILYQICLDQSWDYLSLRLWIGIWVGLILIVLVIFDASAVVCYITRFTEELFATLIAFIFIYNAFNNVYSIGKDYKFAPNSTDLSCPCIPPDEGGEVDWNNVTRTDCVALGGALQGDNCDFEPNVFLMSCLLFAGTFTISFSLKNFRNTGYLPGYVRNFLSDFAVIIAILSMSGLSYMSGVHTPKLEVPNSFKPTWEGRDWVVTHALIFADHLLANPWWVDVFLAPVLAILATILIFMDQQITAVIVNRKEHRLQKGGGYHLDLLVLAMIIIICSVFGLPWFVAATVLSINHIQSLTIETECSAPGEKPQFLGIREQRVTAVLISVCIGLSTIITPVLALIPMPVLFGVFLFMGVSSLKGLQFFDRLLLIFIPRKYQPDYVFLKYVPIHRVHMFTIMQLFSLIVLWVIKSNPTTSIGFPVMLVVICGIRKLMECVFTRRELRVLDDLLPENGSKVRRQRGSFFNKIHRSNWEDEEEDEADIGKKTRRLEEEEVEQRRQRNRTVGLELDDFSKTDMKVKAKQLNSVLRQRSSSIIASAVGPTSHPTPIAGPKCLIFVKLSTQEAFTPLNLGAKTVRHLLKRLQAKFSDDIRAGSVAQVFQKTRKNLIFHLDDDMMEFIKPQQVFNIEIAQNEEHEGKINLTFNEIPGGFED